MSAQVMKKRPRNGRRMGLGLGCVLSLVLTQGSVLPGNDIEAMRTRFETTQVGAPLEPESVHIAEGRPATAEPADAATQVSVAVRNTLGRIISDFSHGPGYYVVEGQAVSDRVSSYDHVIRFGVETTDRRGYAKNEWDLADPGNESMKQFADDLMDDVLGRVYGEVLGQKALEQEVALEVHITGIADGSPIKRARIWNYEDSAAGRGIRLKASEPVSSNIQLGYARAICFRNYLRERFPSPGYRISGAEHPRVDERGSYRVVYVDLVLKGMRRVQGFLDLVAFDDRESQNLH